MSSISALPRNRKPGSDSAKWNLRIMLDWVSALKYISVFRATRRSTREIGASCVRSFRPNITCLRRSRRKEYFARRLEVSSAAAHLRTSAIALAS